MLDQRKDKLKDWHSSIYVPVVAADSGSRSFTVSVCFVLVLVFRFLIFSLSGFPALFHRKSCHVSPFPPFAFCYPFLRCSSLRYRPSVFRSLFYALLFFYIIMYAHVCGCGDAASFASLQVCLPFFLFSCFPSAVFVWVPSFFRPYTRVRIL